MSRDNGFPAPSSAHEEENSISHGPVDLPGLRQTGLLEFL